MSANTSVTVNKILVPTDFSEISLQALDFAAMIARSSGAELLLLHVFESYMQNTMLDMRIDFTEVVERGIEDKFNDIKAKNPNLSGITIRSKVALGKIYSEIDRVAAEEDIKLIVMGTHGVSGVTNIGKFIIGSNAYRSIQHSPCPIITVREKPWRSEIKNIVVPLDSTPESTKKLDIAVRWAKFFNATVHLLAVTAFFEEIFVDVKDITTKVHEAEVIMREAGVAVESKIIRHQAPSESVLDYANRLGADLILIVTGQESQLAEMLFGSSARNIISSSPIPVLSVNVHGYKSQ